MTRTRLGPGTSPPRSASIGFADRYDGRRGELARGRTIAAQRAPRIEGSRVLEIGAGEGAVGVGLGDHGHQVVGVDLSPAMLARAHERLGNVVMLGDRDAPGDEWQLSPEDNVRLIEQRVLSDLWDVSDEQWAREVEPTIQRLRALPDPHLPRLRRGVVRLFIADKQ